MTSDPHAEARALVEAWEIEDLPVDEAQEWFIDRIAEIIAVRDAANESLRAQLLSMWNDSVLSRSNALTQCERLEAQRAKTTRRVSQNRRDDLHERNRLGGCAPAVDASSHELCDLLADLRDAEVETALLVETNRRLVCWLFGHVFVQITPRIADGPSRPSDDAKCRRCGMVLRG
jgi:hypothetical protein